MSPVYYQDPARWYESENSRRDEQMRNMLNMILAAKEWKSKEANTAWEQGYKGQQLDVDRQRAASYAQEIQALSENRTSQEMARTAREELAQEKQYDVDPLTLQSILKAQGRHPDLIASVGKLPSGARRDLYKDALEEDKVRSRVESQAKSVTADLAKRRAQLGASNQMISRTLTAINNAATPLVEKVKALDARIKADPYDEDAQKELDDAQIALEQHKQAFAEVSAIQNSVSIDTPELAPESIDVLNKHLKNIGDLGKVKHPQIGGDIGQNIGPATQQTTMAGAAIPPDILAAARAARPDLSEGEIIRRWKTRKQG